uniref:Uncharacterized protein n=1 Tax=Rhizophora mucronata TaxID=61149 RepID=A0A2P2PFG8_RHIMU
MMDRTVSLLHYGCNFMCTSFVNSLWAKRTHLL